MLAIEQIIVATVWLAVMLAYAAAVLFDPFEGFDDP